MKHAVAKKSDSSPCLLDLRSVDLIGDVHGCATTLRLLLERLGYRHHHGCYRHPMRTALFIGDIIDRGNYIRESLHMVYDMVANGAAHCVIGNHEFHALVYHTEVETDQGKAFLRPHTERHTWQLQQTLEQFAAYPQEWRQFVDWFRVLPLFVETPEFRATHACWDDALVEELKRRRVYDLSDLEFLTHTVDRGSFEWQVADRLLRGTYLVLPDEEVMVSSDGVQRRAYRTKFWETDPQTHGDVEFQPDPLPDHIAPKPLTETEKSRLCFYGREQRPLFVGHYWQSGRPEPVCDNIACLDYSAVRQGKLVAYRMDGEQTLRADKFVWVDVDPRDITDGH